MSISISPYGLSIRSKLLISSVALSFLTGAVMIITTQFLDLKLLRENTRIALQIVALGLLIAPVGLVMFAYLQLGRKTQYINPSREHVSNVEEELHRIEGRLDEIDTLAFRVRANALNTEDVLDENLRRELISHLRQQINDQVKEEWINDLRDTARRALLTEIYSTNQENQIERTRFRITTEIEELARRGNLNLILGGCASLVGIVILSISVYFQVSERDDTWRSLLSYFLPRASLVIVIQVFAYFFLSLYRNSLQEIKYFQNELTNIEAKFSALESALRTNDLDIIKNVLAEFASTERNHILLKDQTTVELEKVKTERTSTNELIRIFSELISEKREKRERN